MSEVTLREHIEAQIRWVDRYFESQIKTIQEKTKDAKEQIDKRLEGMNEFRDALKDTTSMQATKDEVLALKEQIDTRLKALEINKANFEGKSAIVSMAIAIVVSILVVVVSKWIVR